MKINEVEALVGISKKNIRFYEEQGLVAPTRNADNRYREYSQNDVDTLCRIKLLRKLGVSIEEIRTLSSGTHTVADCIRRHIVTLEREKQNVEQSMKLCREMQNLSVSARDFDPRQWLEQMENMEKEGTSFSDRQKQDVVQKYAAPVIITCIVVGIMVALITVIVWSLRTAPQENPPLWFIAIFIAVFVAVAAGAVLALIQRIKEIGKGEIDDAKRY